jgi:hypothetical protein
MTVMTIMDMINIAGIIRPYPQSSDMPCVCYTCIRVSALTFIFEIIRRESLMIRTCDKLRHSDPLQSIIFQVQTSLDYTCAKQVREGEG